MYEYANLRIATETRSIRDNNNQSCHRNDREAYAKPNFSQHLQSLDEGVGKLEFLCCGTPSHVDNENVSEDRFRNMIGDAAEEDEEHEELFEIFD
jgi:hypothetical protein